MTALTIYRCPTCAYVSMIGGVCSGSFSAGRHKQVYMRGVRVFREADVRPLWDAHVENAKETGTPYGTTAQAALDAFPAPGDWTAE